MAGSNFPTNDAERAEAPRHVLDLPLKKSQSARPAYNGQAQASGKVLPLNRATKMELSLQSDKAEVREKLLGLLEQLNETQMRGLLFTVDMGNGRHEYGFCGSYGQRPESAYIPAAKTLHELSGAIHRERKDR